MILAAAMLVGGLLILALAADRFVVAAARLSRRWGLSPILVGALIVGMGTSAPEFLVSMLAAQSGEINLALGNAVGSNVSNVTLVLGVTALVAPLSGNARILRREGMLMLAAVVALAILCYDLELGRVEGTCLLAAMAVAALLVVRWARKDAAEIAGDMLEDGGEAEDIKPSKEITLGLLSLGATIFGAELLVRGGIALAEAAGIGSAFIGLTLVAIGTSLPELATAIAGVRRHEHELVVGNVVGSNLFNALGVAGIAATVGPGAIDPSFRVAVTAMVVSAAAAGFLAWTGRTLVRWEGMLLLLGFLAFIWLTY